MSQSARAPERFAVFKHSYPFPRVSRSVGYERSGLATSRLAFGLSRLHHLSSSQERQNLLACAVDVGILHFDVARCYGDGLAERELGRFFRGRRNGLIVATKYGLPASSLIEVLLPIAPPFRAARKLAQQIGIARPVPPELTAAGLRQSLEKSLRALRVDAIDIVFLHEPSLARMPEPAELLVEVARQKARGTIRFIGLSGDYAPILKVAAQHEGFAEIVQVPENQWQEGSYVPDLTFGSMRRGPQAYDEAPLDSQMAIAHLKQALHRRPRGSVVVSTTRRDHLHSLASAAEMVPS
jgi:aryl-alcohol dehydrogenase-like predicted oxidoreductase